MPPITWTERMCVLNPRDRRLTISVLNSIFFPLKSSLSKRITVGSENSYLGIKIMFYYSSLMLTWAHVKIILFQRQSTRFGQEFDGSQIPFPRKSGCLYAPKLKRGRMEGRKFFPCVERQVNMRCYKMGKIAQA